MWTAIGVSEVAAGVNVGDAGVSEVAAVVRRLQGSSRDE